MVPKFLRSTGGSPDHPFALSHRGRNIQCSVPEVDPGGQQRTEQLFLLLCAPSCSSFQHAFLPRVPLVQGCVSDSSDMKLFPTNSYSEAENLLSIVLPVAFTIRTSEVFSKVEDESCTECVSYNTRAQEGRH